MPSQHSDLGGWISLLQSEGREAAKERREEETKLMKSCVPHGLHLISLSLLQLRKFMLQEINRFSKSPKDASNTA